MRRDFRIYPKYYHNYIRAFDRMLEEILDSGKTTENLSWRSGEDVMHWWISDVMTLQGQTTFDGFDILDV